MSAVQNCRPKSQRQSGRPVTAAELVSEVAVDNTAYVIYTSGSTGRPEGCRGIASRIGEFRRGPGEGLDVRRGAGFSGSRRRA